MRQKSILQICTKNTFFANTNLHKKYFFDVSAYSLFRHLPYLLWRTCWPFRQSSNTIKSSPYWISVEVSLSYGRSVKAGTRQCAAFDQCVTRRMKKGVHKRLPSSPVGVANRLRNTRKGRRNSHCPRWMFCTQTEANVDRLKLNVKAPTKWRRHDASDGEAGIANVYFRYENRYSATDVTRKPQQFWDEAGQNLGTISQPAIERRLDTRGTVSDRCEDWWFQGWFREAAISPRLTLSKRTVYGRRNEEGRLKKLNGNSRVKRAVANAKRGDA